MTVKTFGPARAMGALRRLRLPASPARRAGLALLVLLSTLALALPVAGARWRIGIDGHVLRCLDWWAVLIDRHAPLPARGQLVVFEGEGLQPAFADGTLFVKILAGLPGDRVQVTEEGVRVNGVRVAGGLAAAGRLGHPPGHFVRSYIVPEGTFIALGTTPHSIDSRYYGPIRLDRVRGAAWPLF